MLVFIFTPKFGKIEDDPILTKIFQSGLKPRPGDFGCRLGVEQMSSQYDHFPCYLSSKVWLAGKSLILMGDTFSNCFFFLFPLSCVRFRGVFCDGAEGHRSWLGLCFFRDLLREGMLLILSTFRLYWDVLLVLSKWISSPL